MRRQDILPSILASLGAVIGEFLLLWLYNRVKNST